MASSFQRGIRVGLILLLLLQISFCHSEHQQQQETPTDSKVVILTEDNFDDIAQTTRYLLIKFYAPWCGHCKRLSPEYEKAAIALSDLEDVKISKVDVTTEKLLGQKFNIRSLPTLFFIKDGEIMMYSGGRSAADIEKWVRKNTKPITVITTEEELDAIRKKERTSSVVVGSFVSREGEEYKNFKALSNNPVFGDLEFVERITPTLEASSITLFTFDNREISPEESLSITEWIIDNAYPVIGGMEENDIKRYETKKLPLSVLFFNPANKEENDAVLEIFKQAANSIRGRASFAATDGVPGIQSFRNLGYQGDLPVLAMSAFNAKGANFLSVSPTTSVEEVQKWIIDVVEGRVKPQMMSQEIPTTPPQPGEVTVVVGKTFEELVLDPTKDVLLEIYSPGCGHCKNLEPVYAQLAKFFENNEKIRIAKIDGTANDIEYDLTGFPTILFYGANNKQPIVYEKHTRTLEELKEFVLTHSSAKEQTETKDEL